MLVKLPYSVPNNIIEEALHFTVQTEFRTDINEPSGRFFYDPWEIKEEYRGTVWEKILQTLPFRVGQARIIILKSGTCYTAHADIDDRYHLNIQGEQSYIIDIENNKLHPLMSDGCWWEMDAGRIHSASNFGRYDRIQLVVRKLLEDTVLTDPVSIKIFSDNFNQDDARFLFDNTVSEWLNRANKEKKISEFSFDGRHAYFKIERNFINGLKLILIDGFELEIINE
jgi:hypothetical protein